MLVLIERLGMDKKSEARLADFEKMLAAVQDKYADIVKQMEKLKMAGKEKSATYRQLFANKMMYQNMLSLYEIYGLTEEDTNGTVDGK